MKRPEKDTIERALQLAARLILVSKMVLPDLGDYPLPHEKLLWETIEQLKNG